MRSIVGRPGREHPVRAELICSSVFQASTWRQDPDTEMPHHTGHSAVFPGLSLRQVQRAETAYFIQSTVFHVRATLWKCGNLGASLEEEENPCSLPTAFLNVMVGPAEGPRITKNPLLHSGIKGLFTSHMQAYFLCYSTEHKHLALKNTNTG